MIVIIFYSLMIVGFVMAIKPIIMMILTFIRDTIVKSKEISRDKWHDLGELDRKRIKYWTDAYHRGEGNYEHHDPDDIRDKEMMKTDYDKYDDPFYIGDNDEKKH